MSVKQKRLLASSLLDSGIAGEENPMDSMGNLMDVMLVFACGLMIALVARYNVQLTPSSELNGDVERLDQELEQVSEGISTEDEKYAEMGTVYRDTETGELYVVVPEGVSLNDD